MATAKKAEIKDAKIKCMIWGEPGSGKSRFSLSAPSPLVIDFEESTILYSNEFDFMRAWIDASIETQKNPTMLTSTILTEIEAGEYPEIKTLVIDPITDLLENIEEICATQYEKQIGKAINTLNQLQKSKWYSFRRKTSRRMLDRLKALPLNLILVARSKNIWSKVDGTMQPVGLTYDCLEIVESLMDVVIQLDKKGKETTAIINKSRIGDLDNQIPILEGYNSIIKALEKKKVITKTAIKEGEKNEGKI